MKKHVVDSKQSLVFCTTQITSRRNYVLKLWLNASVVCCLAGYVHAQPVLIESHTPTNTDTVFWSYPSGTWGKSSNLSKVPSTPPFAAIASGQTTDSVGPPSFQVTATNAAALQAGIKYAVQITTPTSPSQPPPDDLVVAIGLTGVTNSTLPATTTAFASEGVNKWTTLGEIICSDSNPTFTFAYVSGSLSSSPARRFYTQCIRFIPQGQTNATRIWTGGARAADPMWNNPANWGGTAPRLSGDDLQFDGATGLYSVPDGPFSVNSLKFMAGAGAFNVGTNFSGPITVATTNGIANLSTTNQCIAAPISQGNAPLIVDTGTRMLLLSNTLSGNSGYSVGGLGTLYLRTPGSMTNPITGPILVHTGATLKIAKHFAIGSTDPGAGDVTLDGSTLRNDDTTAASPFLSANRNIIIGPGGATLSLSVASSQNLIYDGVISNSIGNGPLVKDGSGKLTLGGPNPNTYTGPTTVNSGRLILSKTSSNAVPGNLFVPAGTVQLTASDQIGDTATVTVSGGLLGLSDGVNDTVGHVILNGGSITGAVSTLTATNFDFRSGTNTATLAGDSDFLKTTAGTVLLASLNSYTGKTTVSGGNLLVNGTIGPGLVTVTGGTLGGNGDITGPVEIQSGSILSPGLSVGRLAINTLLELQSGSTTFMELDKTGGTNDAITGPTLLIYGGTLAVTNIGGTLQKNDTFKLFDAAAYSGTFASFNLPALDAGLVWDTSHLTVDGAIKVTVPQPHITSAVLQGANLVLTGDGGPTNGYFYVLASTDVALPLTNWSAVATGMCDGTGQFLFTNSFDPGSPQIFFIIQVP